MERHFYSVIGENGYGVVDSYKRVINNAQIYLKCADIKRYDNFIEAANYSFERVKEIKCTRHINYNYVEPSELKMNDIIFLKNLPILKRIMFKKD